MAPVVRREADCPIPFNISSIDRTPAEINTQTNNALLEDEGALWYIVVTLLFYSLGIIIGIVTYLKKEKQEIEENKMFDEFIAISKGQTQQNNADDRLILVQKTIDRLRDIETAVFLGRSRGNSTISGVSFGSRNHSRGNIILPAVMEREYAYPGEFDVSDENMMDSDDDPFQNRRLSQVVAKIFESDSSIGHVSDDLTADTETGGVTEQHRALDTMQRSDSSEIETDFIDYNEEPKNKTLQRELGKGSDDDLRNEELLRPLEPSLYDAKAVDTVCDTSKRRQSLLEKFAHGDLESIEEETENPTYKWSVTSV